MNREKTKEFAQSFFSASQKITRDLDDVNDVSAFFKGLNKMQNELGHEWYIEEVSPLTGGDVSTVATIYVGGLLNTILFDWDVPLVFNDINDLLDFIETTENTSQSIKTLLAQHNNQ